jgi:hypothetical protein
MPEEAWFVICRGTVIWSVFWGAKLERRLSDRLRHGKQQPRCCRGVRCADGCAGEFLLPWLIGAAIGSVLDDPRWLAVTLIPAMLLYGPISMTALPTQFGGPPSPLDLRDQGRAGKWPDRPPGPAALLL